VKEKSIMAVSQENLDSIIHPIGIRFTGHGIDLDYHVQVSPYDAMGQIKSLIQDYFTVQSLQPYYPNLAELRLKPQNPLHPQNELNRHDFLYILDSYHRSQEGKNYSIYPLGFVNTRPFLGMKYRIVISMRSVKQERRFTPDPQISEAILNDFYNRISGPAIRAARNLAQRQSR
jgi:hypothetical protein